jgi:hypothetical protein
MFLLAALPLLGACAGRQKAPHAGIASLWREYQSVPEQRAMALAGDPNKVWIGAVAGGAVEREEAEERALAECRRRRQARRMQAPCLVYASGDEVLWRNR